MEHQPAEPVGVHVRGCPGELGVGGLLDHGEDVLAGAVDGLEQLHVAGEEVVVAGRDAGVAEHLQHPQIGFVGAVEVDGVGLLGFAWRRVAELAGLHLDRRQDLEDVDALDGQPVDLLRRVERVVELVDPAAKPGVPGVGDGVVAAEHDLQQRLELAVERAGRVGRVQDAVDVGDLDGRAAGVGAVELELAAPVDRVRRDEVRVGVVEARPGG